MLRISARYGLVAVIALLLVFLLLAYNPYERRSGARLEACRTAPDSVCLTDLGFERAIAKRVLPSYMQEPTWLAQMGRINQARELAGRSLESNGKQIAPDLFASHEIAAALRGGKTVDQTLRDIPSASPGALWIAALDLLGRNPYGAPRKPTGLPENRITATLDDISEMIATIAADQPANAKARMLVHAAEIQAAVGDRPGAMRYLNKLPQTDVRFLLLSEDLGRLIGTQTARKIYQAAGVSSRHFLKRLAVAEPDHKQAETLFKEAFRAYATDRKWPDFSAMQRLVQQAVANHHNDLALTLARRMARLAETTDYPFQMFANIHAASALMTAGAPDAEIRDSIAFAENLFPKVTSEFIAWGLESGPILWGSSGLEAAARRGVARLRSRLGDIDQARRLMAGLDLPVFSWNDMLTPAIPAEHLDALILSAGEVLIRSELGYVRAQLAAAIIRSDASAAHQKWAVETSRDLLDQELLTGEQAIWAYTSVLRVAVGARVPGMAERALNRMAQSAIRSRSYTDLIKAGLEWHLHKTGEP